MLSFYEEISEKEILERLPFSIALCEWKIQRNWKNQREKWITKLKELKDLLAASGERNIN